MKKNILILAFLCLTLTGLQGCKKETSGGLTDITYYATLELLGEEVVFVDKGSTYDDEGVYAELQGEDISDQVKTTSTVNTDQGGIYNVTYSVVNADGFSKNASRTVYVVDPTPSAITSGEHVVVPGTNRTPSAGGAAVVYSGYPVLILQMAPGEFYISDFFGGYYDVRAGYGPSYAMTGRFKLNSDNSITLVNSLVAGWGDSLDALSNGEYDPETGRISFTAAYAGSFNFNVIID